ncbi:MAG TPA: hypothetical protein VGV35_21180, partial [Bryobacteraceae bacterium]|nr:hypothetical protein [Bryobacteraceae bacterium]
SPLAEFDYLSTVSGGGYVGSWFSAWAAREEEDGKDGPAAVVDALAQTPLTKLDPEPEPLLHLRRYCRFLNPKMGALSADTWTLVATVGRNMILNWLVLIPLIMAVLILPLLYLIAVTIGSFPVTDTFRNVALWLGAGFGAWATAYIGFHVPTLNRPKEGDVTPPKGTETSFVLFALAPFFLSALFLTLHWAWYMQANQVNYTFVQFCVFGAGVFAIGSLAAVIGLLWRGRVTPGLGFIGVLCSAVSGLGAGAAGYLVSNALMATDWNEPELYTCVAVPLVLLVFHVAAILAVGFTSDVSGDDDREWWARSAGWVLIVIVVWLVFSTAVILAPEWLEAGVNRLMAAAATAGVGGVASWLGHSGKTLSGMQGQPSAGGKPKSSPADLAAKFAGPVFLLMLVTVLSMANDGLLQVLSAIPWPHGPFAQAGMLAVALLAVALISSFFININRFSLHAMYRARLIRTYLGASRPDRDKTANPFTDLDEADNIALTKLVRKPLHIVNMALNLVGGKNLAWQQRKAESFTASRLRTGSLRIGYQNTDFYARHGHPSTGFSLGSAMAISGAAASPNMGYHSSALLSLVMTLFNARLGWWLANPGVHGDGVWGKDGPTISFVPILNEALGRTNDESTWVYLSDGGHFENLGVYEMILRRCRTIVVVDGSQDEPYTFEDLGNAVRKARVDLGIPIEFDGIPIYGPRDTRNRYCAIGNIDYKCVDGEHAHQGRILYIKACMKGTEPTDVLHYASMDSKFPQQGTDELWFDEAQFESYRRLGAYIVEEIAGAAMASAKPVVEQFVDAAKHFIGPKLGPRFAGWPKPGQLGGSIAG